MPQKPNGTKYAFPQILCIKYNFYNEIFMLLTYQSTAIFQRKMKRNKYTNKATYRWTNKLQGKFSLHPNRSRADDES